MPCSGVRVRGRMAGRSSHNPHECRSTRLLAAGLQLDFATFAQLYADIFSPVQLMIQQQQLLRSSGVPTYLLSNCSALHIDDVRERYPFFSTFDGLCLSYLERSFKPEPEIYAATERLTGLSGADLVFIDDRADNAAAAGARGWQAIHHTSPEATLLQLQQLGLPVVAAGAAVADDPAFSDTQL